MGIEGLLSFLKPIITSTHISAFEEQAVAIDAMSWLYRGCYSCSYEINMNIKTKDYLYFLHKNLLMLRRHKIKAIMVFDGRSLYVKKKTEEQRRKLKNSNLEKAQSFLQNGDEKEARKYFSRALKITKEMIYQAIDLCRQLKVDFILAPYEADAQIAFLLKNSYAHTAISEDSDLIAYGCQKIILKLSSSGDCQYLNITPYKESINRIPLKDKQLKIFLGFQRETMISACIMAGCDYLPNIKGIGIKKAIDFLDRSGGKIDSTIRRLQFEKTFMGRIPQDYAKTVKNIAFVFKYQRIYDPAKKNFACLEPLPQELKTEAINLLIGEEFEQVENFAMGDLDIKKLTKREIENATLKELFSAEVARRFENFEKIERKQVENERKTNKIEDLFEVFEDNNGDLTIKEATTPKKTMGNQGNEANLKMDEQIDFLFDLCKELAFEFGTQETQELKNQEAEKIANFEEAKEIHEIKFDKNEGHIQNISKYENITKRNKNPNSQKIQKKVEIPFVPITEKKSKNQAQTPKNPKLQEKSQITQDFLSIPKNPFSLPNEPHISPENKKNTNETLLKSPENPFLISTNKEKKENIFLDSLAKISTEKKGENLKESIGKSGLKSEKESASKSPLINKQTIIPSFPTKTEGKDFIFSKNKRIEETIKKPEKRKEEKNSVFEESQKENGNLSIFSSFAKKNEMKNPTKKVKMGGNFTQPKIQSFFIKSQNK